LNAWNPRYKTRYKTADIVEKLENDIKLLLFDLQNPAVRTTFCDAAGSRGEGIAARSFAKAPL
jgi:hypothetical protein